MRKIVAGNWKMNLDITESRELTKEVVTMATQQMNAEVWIAPSPEALFPCSQEIPNNSPLKLGAQNVAADKKGAFTGETSARALKEIGCSFAIVGHSERRHLYGETDTLVTQRALGALAQEIEVCFCIGETIQQRKASHTESTLKEQLIQLLNELPAEFDTALVFAYEPVWAIGTGEVATLEQIEQAHTFIQQLWAEHRTSTCPAILYGGSVKPTNFQDIISIASVAGALVGGASLQASSFAQLIRIANESDLE